MAEFHKGEMKLVYHSQARIELLSGDKESPHWRGGLSLQRSADASCEVQRAIIYLSDDRDCCRGAGSHVPVFVPALRSAPSAALEQSCR